MYVEPAVNPKLAVVKQEEQKSIFVKVSQTKATDMNSQVGLKIF